METIKLGTWDIFNTHNLPIEVLEHQYELWELCSWTSEILQEWLDGYGDYLNEKNIKINTPKIKMSKNQYDILSEVLEKGSLHSGMSHTIVPKQLALLSELIDIKE